MRAGRVLRRRAQGRARREMIAAVREVLGDRDVGGMMYGDTSGGSERLGEWWGEEMVRAPHIGFRA